MKLFSWVPALLLWVPAAHGEALTVQSAIEVALEHNPSVQAAREKAREAAELRSAATSALFPNLAFTGAGTYRKDAATNPLALFGAEPYNNYFVGLTLRQPIYEGGLLTGGMGLARAGESEAELNERIAVRDLSLKVVEAFYAVLLAEHEVAILEENQKLDDNLLKTIRSYQRLGRTQLLDVLQVRTQLALLVPKIAQARNQVKTAALELATLLGYRDAPEVELRGTIFAPDRARVERLFQSETPRLYEIERAQVALDAVDARRSLTLAKNLPSVELVGNWGRNAYVKTDLFDDGATTWALSLQFTVPIFSGLSSVHERAATASQLKQAEISRIDVENRVTLAQVETQKQLDLSQEMHAASGDAYRIARQAIDEAQRQFRLGQTNLVTYLQAEQSFLDAETAYERSKYDFMISLLRYGSARGYDPQKLLREMEPTR